MNIALTRFSIQVEEVNNKQVARKQDWLEIANAQCLHHVLAKPAMNILYMFFSHMLSFCHVACLSIQRSVQENAPILASNM